MESSDDFIDEWKETGINNRYHQLYGCIGIIAIIAGVVMSICAFTL